MSTDRYDTRRQDMADIIAQSLDAERRAHIKAEWDRLAQATPPAVQWIATRMEQAGMEMTDSSAFPGTDGATGILTIDTGLGLTFTVRPCPYKHRTILADAGVYPHPGPAWAIHVHHPLTTLDCGPCPPNATWLDICHQIERADRNLDRDDDGLWLLDTHVDGLADDAALDDEHLSPTDRLIDALGEWVLSITEQADHGF